METTVVERQKADLRQNLLGKILSLTKEEIKRRSVNVINNLYNWSKYKNAKCIMVFFPLRGEVDILEMIRKAFGTKKICFPVMDLKSKDLSAYAVNNLTDDFVLGPYKVRQPDIKKTKEVTVSELDMVIVPGLAFDKHKNRLGRGAGFYDRFLSKLSPQTQKVGIGFDFQILESLPISLTHDQKVDTVVSENSIF